MKKFYNLGINGRGVQLHQCDLQLLKYLLEQKVLTSKQLHQFANTHEGVTYNTFRHRLWRWQKNNIIVTEKLTNQKRFGNEFNLNRIGRNGLSMLVQEGVVDPRYLQENLGAYFQLSNYDHYLAISK
ncbi:hypothetical protein GCM10008934_16510 [Virgibacillus salarius]|uniref:hypothetical protein n=1 Tax=Virgibacillus salarius TaxID=447199 RepID=UPI0031E2C77B